jgi:ABC-2 type transport system permease protein
MYAWLDLIWVTRSSTQFILYYLSELIVSLAALTSLLLLAERFNGLGPWGQDQLVFMLGYAALVSGFLDMFFGFNVLFIGRRLGRGQFDHTLIQPQPIWMALLTDGFNPFGSSGTFLAGTALLLWSAPRLTLPLSLGWLSLFGINVLASAAIVLSVSFVWGSLAFWAPRAAEEINTPLMRIFDSLKFFPLDGLSVGMATGLLTAMPVGFVAWYPARALVGLDSSGFGLFTTPLAAVAFAALAAFIFQQGMRHYARLGSGRYRAMGHRG